MEDGLTNEELFDLTKIDPWWLAQLRELFDVTTWCVCVCVNLTRACACVYDI
jgi:hypothetical protein